MSKFSKIMKEMIKSIFFLEKAHPVKKALQILPTVTTMIQGEIEVFTMLFYNNYSGFQSAP